ncbi:hypothetical protein LJC16_01450 [Bacteroidales bacterium OttesenSCG-928-C19]|nr:hypothetical protein [Bacteroidales bacterium OttesenSCG-928-C19]
MIETILRQTKKPDKIILWLSEEQFQSKNDLPKNLLILQKRGLTIELRSGDFRSHKKYFYTLREYPNDIMITVDDDIFYPTDMIRNLIQQSKKYPKCVIANYTRIISYNENQISPYIQWEYNYYKINIEHLFFGSGGGTLFPPNSLPTDATNSDIFMSICPTADDIWLNAMCKCAGFNIRTTTLRSKLILPVLNQNNERLFTINSQSQNDIQIAAVTNYCKKKFGQNPFTP